MKKLNKAIILASGMLLGMGSAFAAGGIVLSGIQGEVLINQGENYATATSGMTVAPNNLLMVGKDSTAKLTYPNKCVLEVKGEFILTVKQQAPCEAGALLATAGGAAAVSGGATVGGAAVASGGAAGGGAAAVSGAAIAGGVIVGAGIIALAANNDNNNNGANDTGTIADDTGSSSSGAVGNDDRNTISR